MSALSSKELSTVIDSIQDQGAVVERSKKGYLVKFPNGGSTTFHITNSDVRSTRNMRAEVRRAGLSWPFDARKDPGMDPRTQRTYALIRKALEELPEKFTMDQLLKASGRSTGPIHRYLHDYGYTHRREGTTIYWRRIEAQPEPPAAEVEVETYPEIEKARSLLELQTAAKAEEVPTSPPSREFIDTVDSWVVSTPEDLQNMATAMGLRIEVRVWRE